MVRPLLSALCLCLLLAGVAVAGVGTAVAGGAFLAEVDDLPLAPGLTEIPGGTLFDTAAGRIVEATARGTGDASAVRAFYAETLPGLGWSAVGTGVYVREHERLRIAIAAGPELVVHFSLAPLRAGAPQQEGSKTP